MFWLRNKENFLVYTLIWRPAVSVIIPALSVCMSIYPYLKIGICICVFLVQITLESLSDSKKFPGHNDTQLFFRHNSNDLCILRNKFHSKFAKVSIIPKYRSTLLFVQAAHLSVHLAVIQFECNANSLHFFLMEGVHIWHLIMIIH